MGFLIDLIMNRQGFPGLGPGSGLHLHDTGTQPLTKPEHGVFEQIHNIDSLLIIILKTFINSISEQGIYIQIASYNLYL